jgi:hypothetical protein
MNIKDSVLLRTVLTMSAILVEIASASKCSPVSVKTPSLNGASILDIQAQEAHNFSAVSLGPGTNEGSKYTINFCNVTVIHAHPS